VLLLVIVVENIVNLLVKFDVSGMLVKVSRNSVKILVSSGEW